MESSFYLNQKSKYIIPYFLRKTTWPNFNYIMNRIQVIFKKMQDKNYIKTLQQKLEFN